MGALVLFFLMPFAAGAAIHFWPWWAATPAAILAAILWIGAIGVMQERSRK